MQGNNKLEVYEVRPIDTNWMVVRKCEGVKYMGDTLGSHPLELGPRSSDLKDRPSEFGPKRFSLRVHPSEFSP